MRACDLRAGAVSSPSAHTGTGLRKRRICCCNSQGAIRYRPWHANSRRSLHGRPGDAGAAWDQDRQGRLDEVRACVFPACTAARRTEVGGPGMAEGSQGRNREAAPAGD